MKTLREAVIDLKRAYAMAPAEAVREAWRVVDSIIASPVEAKAEAGEWRGPWKCDGCGNAFAWDTSDEERTAHYAICGGSFMPWERRTRPAPAANTEGLREALLRYRSQKVEAANTLSQVDGCEKDSGFCLLVVKEIDAILDAALRGEEKP